MEGTLIPSSLFFIPGFFSVFLRVLRGLIVFPIYGRMPYAPTVGVLGGHGGPPLRLVMRKRSNEIRFLFQEKVFLFFLPYSLFQLARQNLRGGYRRRGRS